MSELKFPDWQCALQEAILEASPDRLQQRIKDVEQLICLRRLQLEREADILNERQALDDAAGLLRLLGRYSVPEDEGSRPQIH